MDELLDVVDEGDNIIGAEKRSVVHRKGLIHRTVMFFIFDSQKRIFVNRRSRLKEFFKGAYSIALGGHVRSGQNYLQAAKAEAHEEAGMISEPVFLGRFKKRIPQESENVEVFGFTCDKEPVLDRSEIEWGMFMDPDQARIMAEKEDFLPETGDLFAILEEAGI